MKKKISIIGSTGSIGRQAIDVVRQNPDSLEIVALAAGGNARLLAEQAREFGARYAVVADERSYNELVDSCECWTGQGAEAIGEIASLPETDQVLIAVSGAAGINPTLKAAEAGKMIALANKESLVAAGEVIMPLIAKTGAQLIPVDSEHSAIFQCLRDEIRFAQHIWLTASGGPFRGWKEEELKLVTPEMALKHPNWQMGPKITVDSASLMNKGLEVIEAFHLFRTSYDNIKVVIHPQSIVHSMVEFIDGSFLAHLGVPDMRIPIQYAFSYPERWAAPVAQLDPLAIGSLDFIKPDMANFPCLEIAIEAGRRGGTAPAVMNAANEVAVERFLRGEIKFTRIPDIIAMVLDKHKIRYAPDLSDIINADNWSREVTSSIADELR
ncbi:MAG: 1-deoxy-D-xylulose-5-phosphate reductoisomerase [Chitinophagales bacterium]